MTPYNGDVTEGQWQVRSLADLTITKIGVGDFGNNAYLLECARGGLVLVDAAADAPLLLSLVGERKLDAVVTTHRHGDHHGALADVVAATGAAVIAHPADAPELPVPATRLVTDGDALAVGDCTWEVIALTGHTPGSIALYWPYDGGHLITGDSLFPGGVGRTWSPEDFDSLLTDVSEKIFARLPDSTTVYPGHGADTTLGAQRPHLAEWRARGW